MISCKVACLLLGDVERCLGSEGEDEGSVWGMDALDGRDVQDKISLTDSPELGSPAGCVSPPRERWRDVQTTDTKDPERTEHSMFRKFSCLRGSNALSATSQTYFIDMYKTIISIEF